MENIFNNAPFLSFSCKDDGILADVNETLCNKLGYDRNELVGKKVDTIFTIATRIFQQTHFFPLLKMQGYAEEIFISLLSKNKSEIPVLINAERKTVNDKNIYVHAGIIVYNRKKFEEELIAARKTAEKALKENTGLKEAKDELRKNLEELDRQMYLTNQQKNELAQFNNILTHDLQEPLRKFSMFSSLLTQEHDPQKQKAIIHKIAAIPEKMRSILSGLQQYVWLTEAKLKITEVDLNNIILLTKLELENKNPGITLQINTESLPIIYADPEQLKALFLELLNNAIRFRKDPDKVFINIAASSLMLNSYKMLNDNYKYSEFLKLTVKDNGIGFNSEVNHQAFHLFKRMHANSGRGVGLSLCKKIVQNHKGDIEINSEVDKGTTVTLYLPLLQPGIIN